MGGDSGSELQGSQRRRAVRRARRREPRRPYAAGMGELIPLFPLGTPLFPGVVLPLQIFEPRYRRLMRDLLEPIPRTATAASSASSPSGRAGRSSRSRPPRRSTTSAAPPGCSASVPQPDGGFRIVTVGGDRFRLLDVVVGEDPPYLQAEVEWLAEEEAAEEAAGDSEGIVPRGPMPAADEGRGARRARRVGGPRLAGRARARRPQPVHPLRRRGGGARARAGARPGGCPRSPT